MSENVTRFAAEFAAKLVAENALEHSAKLVAENAPENVSKPVVENAPEKVTEFVAESVWNTRQNLLGINYRNFIICTDNFPIPSR